MNFEIEEILEIFPEAVVVLKKDLADLTDYREAVEPVLKDNLSLLLKGVHKRAFHDEEHRKVHTDFVRNFFYIQPLLDIDRLIKKLERLIKEREWKRKPSDSDITDLDIAKAKDFSLSQLIGAKPDHSGFIVCPFHAEKTPSFKIYNDKRWFCFGACATGGDTIDFVMKKDALDFIKAVRKILNK